MSTNRAVQIAAGQAVEVSIEDVARNFGIADETLASEFAETFTVREPTALGVVQINPDNLIQIGLPLLQDVPLGDEPIEPGEEPAPKKSRQIQWMKIQKSSQLLPMKKVRTQSVLLTLGYWFIFE